MPVFDLKYAHVYARDGYRATGAVHNVSGYPIASTTMLISGLSAAPDVGSIFTLETRTQIYSITASSGPTSGDYSVTFTPGLITAAVDGDDFHIIGHQLDIKLGEGTLTVDEKNPMEYIRNRGLLDEVRRGPEEPMDVSLNAQLQFFTGYTTDPGGGLPTIRDILTGTGLASNWVSSDLADPCRPYAIDLVIVYDPACSSTFEEVVTVPTFRWENSPSDLKAGTVNVTGKSNAKRIVAVRQSQTKT